MKFEGKITLIPNGYSSLTFKKPFNIFCRPKLFLRNPTFATYVEVGLFYNAKPRIFTPEISVRRHLTTNVLNWDNIEYADLANKEVNKIVFKSAMEMQIEVEYIFEIDSFEVD